MSKGIAIVCVTNDLSTDQRVHRTCMTLVKCGYKVIEYGRLLKNSLPISRPYETKRTKHLFNKGPLFYAEYNLRLFFYLLFAKTDLIFSNDSDTVLASYFASKLRNKKIIFDAHELFPEVPELANRKVIKKIWTQIEKFAIKRIKHSLTVCHSISLYYKKKYGIEMKVVRNIPSFNDKTLKKESLFDNKKVILYQGAVNMGRGLEWIIDAMHQIEGCILLIIGDGDIRRDLESKVKMMNLEEKIKFLGRINAEKLNHYTFNSDMGLCLLDNIGLNYYYALPNRIFDYIHAGIPVLASDFPEIKYIVETYQTGIVTSDNSPNNLAREIQRLLNEPVDKGHLKDVASQLCWENEEKELINLINQV